MRGGGIYMNGHRSICCNAPTDRDATGDVICIACGIIEDNYPKEETQENEEG